MIFNKNWKIYLILCSISLRKVRKDLKKILIKVYCLKFGFNNMKESIRLFFKINFEKIYGLFEAS